MVAGEPDLLEVPDRPFPGPLFFLIAPFDAGEIRAAFIDRNRVSCVGDSGVETLVVELLAQRGEMDGLPPM